MRHPSRHLGRAVFGAAVLAALGFGAAQAFAAPADTSVARNHCQEFCNPYCIGEGYAGGTCGGVSGQNCLCY
ncbi:MAG TPA: hypothetical protein VHG28_12680 [Longimicrobiaceae bacterium]|nr:hypothetical protein [Longimicrobiaceae bacterium]